MCILPVAANSAPQPGKTKIIVGGESNNPPFSFLNEKGEPVGFSVDITRAIAKTMGMEVEIRLSLWADARKALENGKIDVILGMFYSEERAKIYDFSPPFVLISNAIFARTDSPPANSISDLRNKEIIVMRGEVMHDYIINNRLTDRLLVTETPDDALRLLASGKGDYALVARMLGVYWIKELKLSNVKVVGTSLEPFKNCYAVRKGNALLLSQFTEGLNILNQTGEHQKIYEKWLGVLEPSRITPALVFKYAAIVVVPLSLLLAFSLLWSWMLRSKVKQKTEEIQASEERFRSLVSNIPGIVYRCASNSNWTMLFISNEIESISDYPAADFINNSVRSYASIIHPDDLDLVDRAVQQGVKEKAAYTMEYRICRADGHIRWVHEQGQGVFTPDGNLLWLDGVIMDITEHKQAEEELRESNDKFRMLAEKTPLSISVSSDVYGAFEYINQKAVEMFGYTIEDIPTVNDWYLLAYPDEDYRKSLVDEWKRRIIPAMEAKSTIEPLESVVTCKDGSKKNIEWGLVSMGNRNIIYGLNLTDRKLAEEALQESERKYRLIFENSPIGHFFFDENGVIVECNSNFVSIIGSTREALIGLNTLNLPDKKMVLTIREALSGRIGRYEDVYHSVTAKKATQMRGLFAPMISEGGMIAGGVGIIEDITDRKSSEEMLNEINRRLLLATTSAKAGVWDWNIQTNEMIWDDRMLELYGLTPDNFPGAVEAWERGLHPADSSRATEECQAALNGDRDFDTEFRVLRPDMTVAHIKANGIVLRDEEGKPFRMIGLNTDITSRRQAEEEKCELEARLARAEKMESLGLLAGGVAHDLNNVLGIIVGYSEMLLSDIDEQSPLREDVVTIMGAGQRAAAIVQDMLTIARRGVSSRKVLNLNRLIDDFKKSPDWEKLLSYHPDVKIETELESDLLNISGSSVHLDKTLYNLVSNASEAMTKGGNITIKTSNQYIDKPLSGYDNILEGDYVVLSVSDEGEGISKSDIQQIFEPFYTKKIMGRSGTGLGLAVVWGTVKDHDGYINVESEEGSGTSFTLYFPVIRENLTNEASAVPLSEYLGNGESILVVDDVMEQRELATRMLTSLNYNVSCAVSGENAVEYLRYHKVDLVVLDMIMDPGMDGLDTYKKVIEIHNRQKAIIVSGFSESERVHDAQALGAGKYLKKPYVVEKLGLAVKKELDRAT